MTETTVFSIFKHCVSSVQKGILIERESSTDKEFHFQNWFECRLKELDLNFEIGGRNSYPDFRIVNITEGYELKGLAYPGRDANFDSNSQVPTGFHNGRSIFYVFGRYPKTPDGNKYPVLDLVICHGDFLNADHEYVHENKNVKGFGSYGDIMIRDRKMYVVPTPFRLVEGLAHQLTLILPSGMEADKEFEKISSLIRKEAADLIVGYSFNLQTNDIQLTKIPNPDAGKSHVFTAWRMKGSPESPLKMREIKQVIESLDENENE